MRAGGYLSATVSCPSASLGDVLMLSSAYGVRQRRRRVHPTLLAPLVGFLLPVDAVPGLRKARRTRAATRTSRPPFRPFVAVRRTIDVPSVVQSLTLTPSCVRAVAPIAVEGDDETYRAAESRNAASTRYGTATDSTAGSLPRLSLFFSHVEVALREKNTKPKSYESPSEVSQRLPLMVKET